MNQKVRNVLNQVLERFKTGKIPEAIALSQFPIPNIPANKWSLLNRTLMFFSGTQDARGYRQWQEAGRQVKKGAKAIYILAPSLKKVTNEETEEDVKLVLKGFLAIAVFRAEDTEGDPLDYQQIKLPELPLMEVAEEWGISVKAIPGNYRIYGCFSKQRNEIALASQEEVVFFHELAHAGHSKITKLEKEQNWKKEIVAELSASVLCHIVGKDGSKHLGQSYRYIEDYAQKAKLNAYQGCIKVMSDVEKVLTLILGGKNGIYPGA